jgi:choline kinase
VVTSQAKEEELRILLNEHLTDIKQEYIKIAKHEKIINEEIQKIHKQHEQEVTVITRSYEKELMKHQQS